MIDPLELVDQIARLPADWHGAGSVSPGVLRRIAHAAADRPLRRSVETGSGRTTLLLSHVSEHHTVFAVDAGGSMSQVRNSHLFNAGTTTFIEGPTQRTLPAHSFDGPHDLVLIDGPHGYPFPDLEYFYLYPTLATGAWLIVDDIQIPTIARMFEILRADAMFALAEVVDGNTAFFRRTDAPAINPHSDSWWEQGYNRSYHQQLMGQTSEIRPPAAPAPAPAPQAAAVPESWWRRLRR